MSTWTTEATTLFHDWIKENEPAWLAEGADIDELRDDLRGHVEAELGEGGEIGDERLLPLLQRLSPAGVAADPVTPSPTTGSDPKGRPLLLTRKGWAWIKGPAWWGAIWPAIVLLFELISGFTGTFVFDPLPTWMHVLLLAFAVGTGFFCWWSDRRGRGAGTRAALAVGVSLFIAAYYFLLYLPVLIAGTVGGVVGVAYTIGLIIPLLILGIMAAGSPLFYGLALFHYVRRLRPPRKGIYGGLCLGLLALVLVEGPAYLTRFSIPSENAGLIRAMGSERVLLDACYQGSGRTRTGVDTSGWALNWPSLMGWNGRTTNPNPDRARELYYRVTGRAFNEVDSPGLRRVMGQDRSSDWEWDPDLGGDGVAARIRDLDLAGSRLDGHVESAAGLGYWEWTLIFENRSRVAREARMQVLLPPGGVVSRLTLWVEGQAEEAAFGAKGKVTEAYKSVAVQQRRDPVLARWVAPDRVLVQCFPVPASGEMKIRLGITAEPDALGRLALPRIIERNFGIGDEGEMGVWLQADGPISIEGLEASSKSGPWHETHGMLHLGALSSGDRFARIGDGKAADIVWAKDPFAAADGDCYLIRSKVGAPSEAVGVRRFHVVLDGSASLREWKGSLGEVLAGFDGLEAVYFADDEEVLVTDATLDGVRFAGGRDNLPALRKALEAAAAGGAGHEVLWIHGAQPVDFGGNESVDQILDRAFYRPALHDLQLVRGPNRVIEKLGGVLSVRSTLRVTSPADLPVALSDLASRPAGGPRVKWERTGTEPAEGVEVSDQLVRHQAWSRLVGSGKSPSEDPGDALVAEAVRYQLVTPWTGAVVLERAEQYERFGLEQIDVATAPKIPSVPEPGGVLLLFIALLMGIWPRRRCGRK